MLVSFVYLVACRLFAPVLLLARSDHSKELELLVLRHELSVMRRQARRPQLTESDRLVLAAAEPDAASSLLSLPGRRGLSPAVRDERLVRNLGVLQQLDPGHTGLLGESDEFSCAGAERRGLEVTFARYRHVDCRNVRVPEHEVPERG